MRAREKSIRRQLSIKNHLSESEDGKNQLSMHRTNSRNGIKRQNRKSEKIQWHKTTHKQILGIIMLGLFDNTSNQFI